MNRKIKYYICLFPFFSLSAQVDSNADNGLIKFSNKGLQGYNFKVPEKTFLQFDDQSDKKINLFKDSNQNEGLSKPQLPNRGKDFEDKLNESNNLPIAAFRKNEYFGDVKVSSAFVNIICRDHQYVDGDIVEISVNDSPVKRIMLNSSYDGFYVPLKVGFNKLSFKAMNVGQSYPNTAELLIRSDSGEILLHNQWMLDAGFHATFIVVKE